MPDPTPTSGAIDQNPPTEPVDNTAPASSSPDTGTQTGEQAPAPAQTGSGDKTPDEASGNPDETIARLQAELDRTASELANQSASRRAAFAKNKDLHAQLEALTTQQQATGNAGASQNPPPPLGNFRDAGEFVPTLAGMPWANDENGNPIVGISNSQGQREWVSPTTATMMVKNQQELTTLKEAQAKYLAEATRRDTESSLQDLNQTTRTTLDKMLAAAIPAIPTEMREQTINSLVTDAAMRLNAKGVPVDRLASRDELAMKTLGECLKESVMAYKEGFAALSRAVSGARDKAAATEPVAANGRTGTPAPKSMADMTPRERHMTFQQHAKRLLGMK